ncbi:hypothetical protein ACWA7J_02665 [Leptothrix sp. BB-4]
MSTQVIFDDESRDPDRDQAFMKGVKPLRDACSSARLVSVEGLT